MICISCGGDDDSSPTFNVSPVSINIVLQDGTDINQLDCIDPSQNYAVKISVSANGEDGILEPTEVSYTVNGNTASTTFINQQPKIINISLIEGDNTVQLVDSGQSDTVRLIGTQDFEMVE